MPASSQALTELERQLLQVEQERINDEFGNLGSAERLAVGGSDVTELIDKGAMGVIRNDAKVVPIFATRDGTVSQCKVTWLARTLRDRKNPDGTPAFSRQPMNTEWQYKNDPLTGMPVLINGDLLCFLHPEHPDRAALDQLGLRGITCSKEGLPSEYARERHMERKHPSAKRVIDRAEDDRRREEDREMQRAQLAAMQALAAGQAPTKKAV